jgi:hypothetical protein
LFHIDDVAAAGESEIYEHYAKGEMDRPRLGVPFYIDLGRLIDDNDVVDFQVAVVGAQFVLQDFQYQGYLQKNEVKYVVIFGLGAPCGKKHGLKGLHAEPYVLGLLKKEDVMDLWDAKREAEFFHVVVDFPLKEGLCEKIHGVEFGAFYRDDGVPFRGQAIERVHLAKRPPAERFLGDQFANKDST